MDHRKQHDTDPWNDGVYGTGNTMPPKSHGGIIALLLILVIFLCGIVSALSLLNIKLVWELNRQAEEPAFVPMSFSDTDDPLPSLSAGTEPDFANDALGRNQASRSGENSLGLEGDSITRFDQSYFRIPAGLYLTYVDEASDAYAQGIQPGDILLSLDGTSVTSQGELETILGAYAPGDTVEAVIYRDGDQIDLTLTLTKHRG